MTQALVLLDKWDDLCSSYKRSIFSTSTNETDMLKILRPLVDRLIDSLCYAPSLRLLVVCLS